MSVTIVVGGQIGSEGKGKIISYLSKENDVVVRSGGPNAGHTVCNEEGTHIFHMLPCGIFNKCKLLLSAATMIDVEILIKEIDEYGIMPERLYIDKYATIIEKRHKDYEKEMYNNKLSTGSGIGYATSERVIRKENLRFVKDIEELNEYCSDVWRIVNDSYDQNKNILIEGTQGMDLSLYHGSYPYVTSRDVSPGTLLGEVGLSSKSVDKIVMVLRTFPIRSCRGPLGNEVTWEKINSIRGSKCEPEVSTVTKRIRRVGEFDFEKVKKAIRICRPDYIALTFVDYINGNDYKVNSYDDLSIETKEFIEKLEKELETPVLLIGTGPSIDDIIDLR